MTVNNILIDEIILELGDNYQEDKQNVENIFQRTATIASQISHLPENDEKLFPYIKEAVKAKYLSRGAEGLKSRQEGSISSSYDDVDKKLRQDIISNGLRRIY